MAKRLRRTMLYLPANNPAMLQDAMIYGADSVLLDLEDSITVKEKRAARNLLKYALLNINYGDLEVTVRINPLSTGFGELDLEAIVPTKPDAIRLPKVDTAEDVKKASDIISKIELKSGIEEGSVKLMPMIETARGVQNAYQIASASPRIVALTIGGEDLTADMGINRSASGREIFTARNLIVLAAAAADIDALDTVYSRVHDIEGLKQETELIKELGFTGKAVIHPKQIAPVHEVFRPSDKEVEEAQKVVRAAKEAEEKGLGVITVNGKMVDGPVITRAEKILERASL